MPYTASTKIDLQALKSLAVGQSVPPSPGEGNDAPAPAAELQASVRILGPAPEAAPENPPASITAPESEPAPMSASAPAEVFSLADITAEALLAMWAQCLQKRGLNGCLFFEPGGASLAALNSEPNTTTGGGSGPWTIL
jgi:hypothetical protein